MAGYTCHSLSNPYAHGKDERLCLSQRQYLDSLFGLIKLCMVSIKQTCLSSDPKTKPSCRIQNRLEDRRVGYAVRWCMRVISSTVTGGNITLYVDDTIT